MEEVGVVFDIDGVLVKGKEMIPCAKEALSLLVNEDGTGFRLPVMFVTNAGDHTEQQKADFLAEMFFPWISHSHVIVSHSPLKFEQSLKDNKRILLVGKSKHVLEQIALDYHWTNAQTIQDFIESHQYLFPSSSKADQPTQPIHETERFDAIVILSTPPSWEITIQVLLDLLYPVNGKQMTKVCVANMDFVYQASYALPRLGTGAYLECLELLYQRSYSMKLEYDCYGKPYEKTYSYAEKCLDFHRVCKTIFAIGDNPYSDIQGANSAGPRWYSILVRTGCYQGDQGDNHTEHPAKFVCHDVFEAVSHISAKSTRSHLY